LIVGISAIFTPREVQASREIRRRKVEDKLAEIQRKRDTKEANKQKKEVKERRAAEAVLRGIESRR
jgi:hypothetical protein